jgi:nucleoside-diphosphate-sugar epimerase
VNVTTSGIEGAKIVVTGATGQVGGPLAIALAENNEVYGAARFADPSSRDHLEASGVRCVRIDLASGDVGDLPGDADYVLNFAVAKSNQWVSDLEANSGGLAWLMEHHQGARAFLHCSTTAVYKPAGHRVFDEDAPLGDNHGVWPFLRTYSICKIAAEATARWGARRFGLPTTIARLSVPYGDGGGWPTVHLEMLINGSPIPVHIDAPSVYNPIHQDDILRSIPGLLAAAAAPVTVVNWGGDQAVSIEEWCTYLAELTGLEANFAPTDGTIDSVEIDHGLLDRLVGPTTVPWRDGLRAMVAARHPELLRA